MRYEDWDILLFPRDCKVPVKEFKVACHVVHDAEFSHVHGSFGLPTVCCFVPSLPSAAPFQVSIHSWCPPVASQFTSSYTKYLENVKFEARLFIDGRLMASTTLDRKSAWPHILAHSFDFSKNGELEALRFPGFRQELLQQNYWSPADDLGRIKVVLSEGFPRDSLSMPFERIKNIVSFSFQHAPLDILESSSIAWPNPSMWRRAPFAASMQVPALPSDDIDSHAHSPRHRNTSNIGGLPSCTVPVLREVAANPPAPPGTRRATHPLCGVQINQDYQHIDPFADYGTDSGSGSYFDWLTGVSSGLGAVPQSQSSTLATRSTKKSSTDKSMPDYVPLGPMNNILGRNPSQGQVQDDEQQLGHLKVPTNTPTAADFENCNSNGIPLSVPARNSSFPTDLADSLTNSLLNQPFPTFVRQQGCHLTPIEVRSRKENRASIRSAPFVSMPPAISSGGQAHQEMRRVSQQIHSLSECHEKPNAAIKDKGNTLLARDCDKPDRFDATLDAKGGFASSPSQPATSVPVPDEPKCGVSDDNDKGTNRIRNFTPASARVIDEEDEPRRASPRARLASNVRDPGTTVHSR